MEREYSQLELFSREKEAEAGSQMPVSLREYLRRFEKMVILLICFIVTGIVCFSFGVEKGKSIARVTNLQRLDLAQGAQRQALKPVARDLSPVVPVRAPVQQINPAREITPAPAKPVSQPQQKPQIQQGWFTIQVASYQDKKHAQKESQNLINKGFSPQLLSKGGYTVVCVGNFKEKEKARSLLSQLRLKYRDCYIRRL
jgi:cell division septation protein DedD